MESKGMTVPTAVTPTSEKSDGSASTRRLRNGNAANIRYFLIKAGSSAAKPELGQEMASEGEALIEAFRSGQPFYTVTAWRAVPEVNGSNPVIVKQVMSPKAT